MRKANAHYDRHTRTWKFDEEGQSVVRREINKVY